jgi:hypothetical protein
MMPLDWKTFGDAIRAFYGLNGSLSEIRCAHSFILGRSQMLERSYFLISALWLAALSVARA